jgi:putative flippase GtrA
MVPPSRPFQQILLRFGLTGALGFIVDASVLHLLVTLWDANVYVARGCSFTCAATTTWLVNRIFTFSATPKSPQGLFAEWTAYFVASLGGGCLNYAAFAIAVRLSPLIHQFPSIGVAIGTAVGMTFNFVAYARYVFRGGVEKETL